MARRIRPEQVQSVGKEVRRSPAAGGGGTGAVTAPGAAPIPRGARSALSRCAAEPSRQSRTATAIRKLVTVLGMAVLVVPLRAAAQSAAPVRLDRGRFTVVAYPKDATLARSILAVAMAHDTFPGLPRPREHVLIAIAPDAARFHEWAGPGAPEWGA